MLYNFCLKCGGPLKKEKSDLFVCKKCGFRQHLNPVASSGIIIENEKEEVLLVKRKKNPKKGFWDIPGGFVNLDETLEESVRRELKEELGITTNNFKYIGSYPDIYFYQGTNEQILVLLFMSRISKKKITPRDDVVGFKFFPKNKIPLNKIAFPGLKRFLKFYKSR